MSNHSYEAVYELDDNGSWFVRVPDVKGAHSQGRSLAQARSNIREAAALVLDVEEDSFELNDVVRLAGSVQEVVDSVRELRNKAEGLQEFAAVATTEAVRTLSFGSQALSVRDVAELLGISFQRVQQIRKRAELAGDMTVENRDKAVQESA